MDLYPTIDDKFNRLHNVIGRYDKELIIISCRSNSYGDLPLKEDEVFFKPIGEKQKLDKRSYGRLKYTDDRLSIKDINLGYCNHVYDSIYLARNPSRSTQAGVSLSNLIMFGDSVFGIDLCSKESCDMFNNKYPSLQEAETILKTRARTGVAFHKDYSFESIDNKLFFLRHKNSLIGYKANMSNPFSLIQTKYLKILTPELDEIGVKYVTS